MVYIIVFVSSFLVVVVYMLFCLIFYKSLVNWEILSSYECGFDSMSIARMTFSYRFFLISILFLIFDVEISLMLPIPFLVGSFIGLWLFILFIVILMIGLMYEYYYGSLDWLDNFVSKA